MLSAGYKKWEIGNYWGLEVLPKNGIDLSFDYPLYVLNTQAAAMAGEMGAARVTLSPEDVLRNMKSMAAASPLPSFCLFMRTCCCLSAPTAFVPMPAPIVRAAKSGWS